MAPRMLIAVQLFGGADALGADQRLDGREPMAVIGVAQIWIALGLGSADLRGQGLRPFISCENAAFVQDQRHTKGLGFPGFAKYRAVVVDGQALKKGQVR